MAFKYAHHVIGGVDEPRFLLMGPELSPNKSFEEDLSGVSGSSGSYARVFDSTTPYMDYVLTIEDNQDVDMEYAEITIDTGEAIAGKKFIVLANARNDAAEGDQPIWCVFQGLSGTHEKQFVLDQLWWQVIVHEVAVPADATGNSLVYRIYPFGKSEGNAGQGKIRVDNFRVRKIEDEFTLPLPARGNERQMWRKEYQAKNELIDGTQKSYKKGIRYFYEAQYERLTAAEETLKSKLISTTYDILFFPHKDASTCYFCEWDDDYERNWAFGVAAWGHEGNVSLRGTELLPELPVEIIDSLTEYSFETEEFIAEQNNDSFILEI